MQQKKKKKHTHIYRDEGEYVPGQNKDDIIN